MNTGLSKPGPMDIEAMIYAFVDLNVRKTEAGPLDVTVISQEEDVERLAQWFERKHTRDYFDSTLKAMKPGIVFSYLSDEVRHAHRDNLRQLLQVAIGAEHSESKSQYEKEFTMALLEVARANLVAMMTEICERIDERVESRPQPIGYKPPEVIIANPNDIKGLEEKISMTALMMILNANKAPIKIVDKPQGYEPIKALGDTSEQRISSFRSDESNSDNTEKFPRDYALQLPTGLFSPRHFNTEKIGSKNDHFLAHMHAHGAHDVTFLTGLQSGEGGLRGWFARQRIYSEEEQKEIVSGQLFEGGNIIYDPQRGILLMGIGGGISVELEKKVSQELYEQTGLPVITICRGRAFKKSGQLREMYHLDLMLNVLADGTLLLNPEGIPEESYRKLKGIYSDDIIENRAGYDGNNMLQSGNALIFERVTPDAKAALEKRGYTVFSPDNIGLRNFCPEGFIIACGGPHCLIKEMDVPEYPQAEFVLQAARALESGQLKDIHRLKEVLSLFTEKTGIGASFDNKKKALRFSYPNGDEDPIEQVFDEQTIRMAYRLHCMEKYKVGTRPGNAIGGNRPPSLPEGPLSD